MDTPAATYLPPRQLSVSFNATDRELIVQFSLELAPDESFTPRPEELKLMDAALTVLRHQRHIIPYLIVAPRWIDEAHTRLSLGEVGFGRAYVVQQLDWILYLLQTRPAPSLSP